MILWRFSIFLDAGTIPHELEFYKRNYIKTWYFKMYSDYMLIVPLNVIERTGLYDTKHLFNAQIIKINCMAHDLTIPECMQYISRHWYIPYIKKYQKKCTLDLIKESDYE